MKKINSYHIISIIALIGTLAGLCSCSNDDSDELYYLATSPNESNVKYGTAKLQNLDIFLPNDSSQSLIPVLIYVHGGGWAGGDKSDWGEEAVKAFRELGYLTISINYRLVPTVIFPENLYDVIHGIEWVYSHIESYHGNPHDITLVGHSAGTHLIASVVCNQKYLHNAAFDCHDIHMVCLLDGGGYLAMQKTIYDDTDIYDMVNRALGGNQSNWIDFGPANSIADCDYIPPMVICHSDDNYRVRSNAEFIQKLDDYGFDYTEYTMAGYTHGGMLGNFPYYKNEYDVISHFIK
ncbi:MAG: alpha/beta hydrolase [Bacteroidales bacterium]|nr:alpha/beta hydrolase [Bacteroidales bacterium]